MSYFNVKNIKIEGIMTAVPTAKVNYTDFYEKFGQEHMERFVKSTGVKQVHRAGKEQTASDLGFAAAQALLEKLDIDKNKIGLLVFATYTPDYDRPGNAYILHYRLGLSKECACVDTGLGCPGFVYSLQVAGSMLEDMETEYALLIVSDTCSKSVYPNDQSLVAMFGDAGSAILLKKEENQEIRTTLLRADGKGHRAVIIPGGRGRYPDAPHDVYQCKKGIERTLYNLHMDGIQVFAFAIHEAPEAIKDYFEHTGTCCEDYDSLCLHQANSYIIKQVVNRIKFNKKNVLISIDRYGNTSGVSLPLTLCDFYGSRQGIYKVLACGFGCGLGWGVTTLQIDAGHIFPIIETDDYFKEGKIKIPSEEL